MSTNVNDAIATWNAEHAAATTELEALEATLKADYNKYVDSLAAYVARVQEANDVRQGYINTLGIEDVANGTTTRIDFLDGALNPIENIGKNYLLDRHEGDQVKKSLVMVEGCGSTELLQRKQL